MSQKPTTKETYTKLIDFCKENEFKGWDPFDGLNSKLFRALPFSNFRLPQLLWLQLFKRNPVNLRRLVGIKKEINPHTLGILLSALATDRNLKNSLNIEAKDIIEQLKSLASKGWSGYCWGYNFPWRARAFYQPAYSPTIVPTSYICNGLLDIYEITGDEILLNMARSSCDFILKDLKRTEGANNTFCFSYSPLDKTVVYNASLLASKLLARVSSLTNEKELIHAAEASADYCSNEQRSDGSWSYGKKVYHQWIDSFHTGYNLECLSLIDKLSENDYSDVIEKGYNYYKNNLFEENGLAKYYSDKSYPIDMNGVAQFIITSVKINKVEESRKLVENILGKSIQEMWHKKGYFCYQKNKFYTNSIPYMRWTQIWMLYALTLYQKHYSAK